MEVSFDTLENPFFPLSASVNPIGSRERGIEAEAHKKENNTRDSHLVPHGSTNRASSSLTSEFGMGSGSLCSL